MMVSAGAARRQGFGSASWAAGSSQPAWFSSMMGRKAPRFGCRFFRGANGSARALIQEAEVGVEWTCKRACRASRRFAAALHRRPGRRVRSSAWVRPASCADSAAACPGGSTPGPTMSRSFSTISGVGREPEGLDPVRLQAVPAPGAVGRGRSHAARPCHRAQPRGAHRRTHRGTGRRRRPACGAPAPAAAIGRRSEPARHGAAVPCGRGPSPRAAPRRRHVLLMAPNRPATQQRPTRQRGANGVTAWSAVFTDGLLG